MSTMNNKKNDQKEPELDQYEIDPIYNEEKGDASEKNDNLLKSMGSIMYGDTLKMLRDIKKLRKSVPRERNRVGYSKPSLKKRVEKRRKKKG